MQLTLVSVKLQKGQFLSKRLDCVDAFKLSGTKKTLIKLANCVKTCKKCLIKV